MPDVGLDQQVDTTSTMTTKKDAQRDSGLDQKVESTSVGASDKDSHADIETDQQPENTGVATTKKDISADNGLERQVVVASAAVAEKNLSKLHDESKDRLYLICQALSVLPDKYNAKTTKSLIEQIPPGSRILYSIFNDYIMSIGADETGNISKNLKNLLDNVLETQDEEIDPTVSDIVVKLWDHFQLVAYQKQNIERIVEGAMQKQQSIVESAMKEQQQKIVAKADIDKENLETRLRDGSEK